MAPNKFSTMLHRRTNKITRVLIYALLEWTLIFFLLLNSLFSYFILKFALYFGLKPPCLLCSRLDHGLDSHKKEKNKKSIFSSYTDIICDQHAAELSKIGYCSNHRKLVESHNMCEDCSSSSPSSCHDPELFKADDDDDAKDDVTNKCSCCDEVIKPNTKISSLDFVIEERELLGGCILDQNVQVSSDQSDYQPDFEYQILGDGTEEDEDDEKFKAGDMVFQAEKEPLLINDDDDNGKNKEIVSVITQNLCADMLPQHLEFYIDHDDYRLIPVGLTGDSIKVENKGGETKRAIEKDENKDASFELVFEGDELVLPGGQVFSTTKELPSIQEEEEESIIENLQKDLNDEAILEGSESFEQEFEGCETPNLEILKDEEKMENLENFELEFEGCENQNLEILKDEEKMDSAEKFELGFEGCETQNLEILKDEEKMDSAEKFELVFEENELLSTLELDNKDLPQEEEEVSMIDEFQNRKNEEDEEISKALEQQEEEQEETKIPENDPILDKQERVDQAKEDSTPSVPTEDNASQSKSGEADTEEQNQNPTNKPLIDEYEEDIALQLRNKENETDTEGQNQNQNPTDKPLIEEYEEDIALKQKKYEGNQNPTTEILIEVDERPTPCRKESYSISDNVVSEVSTSCSHDVRNDGESENARIGMLYDEVEEERVLDAPTSSDSLHKKLLLLGRRESATEESLDGMSMISEQGVAGEAIEKLREDLLAERKTLRAVYKELEEERNASAIAANQTMAMITRIQEEKATIQMEALQYQRMMEEQSEYDQEALQMMNELVVKREKEKLELEKELEVYRKKVMDYEEREKMRILCRRRSRNSSASCSYGEESDGVSVDLNQEVKDQEEDAGTPHSREENVHQDTPTDAVLCLQDSLIGFEDERQAILEQLKVLEEKLFTLAEEEEEHLENGKPFEHFYEENGKDFDSNGHGNGNECDSNGFSQVNGQHQHERRMNGSMPKKLLLPLFDAAESLDSPNGELLNGNENGFHFTKFELEKKKFALEEEVDHVYERLQALEADREFLKHCIGSLRKGDKGLDLLQEILQHLRDLKSVELQAIKNMDHCASV